MATLYISLSNINLRMFCLNFPCSYCTHVDWWLIIQDSTAVWLCTQDSFLRQSSSENDSMHRFIFR